MPGERGVHTIGADTFRLGLIQIILIIHCLNNRFLNFIGTAFFHYDISACGTLHRNIELAVIAPRSQISIPFHRIVRAFQHGYNRPLIGPPCAEENTGLPVADHFRTLVAVTHCKGRINDTVLHKLSDFRQRVLRLLSHGTVNHAAVILLQPHFGICAEHGKESVHMPCAAALLHDILINGNPV